ncbi:sugar ABC transporter ATP-binding protein [Mesorhizobium sp. GR13]|uniref:sugar ABC transporter ATP-binding protein n=1 Tax=Mesorhizobium sp. GR13 TaxID=2562308 RepID=UPI0014851A53|nr:sugar ABC transporter ATP-binding protein [Mesorhizobium sp. GR13]
MGETLLRATDITKRFGATQALAGVDFELSAGEIHALIGANGAGKSTLSRILAGLQKPDSGQIEVLGKSVTFQGPKDAIAAGVTLVTQETSLATHITALENIFLPQLARPGRLNLREQRRHAHKLIDELGIPMGFSLDDEVSALSMANRQLVEILKVLALDSKIIFLDEPTTSLSPYECDQLLEVTRGLAEKGHGLVLVSHRMEEIFNFTDRMTVLREGKLVAANVETASIDANRLIRLMVGRELQDVYSDRESALPDETPIAAKVEGLKAGPLVRNVSFSVREGEILGLGGLIGAGRTEVVETMFGLNHPDEGKMELLGRPYVPSSPREAIAAGIGFIGEDRRRHGLIPDFSVLENLMLVHLSMQRKMSLDYNVVYSEAAEIVRSLGLDPVRLQDSDILKFSGGMQQKIIIARWLLAKPRLLILDEPTRGVDIETRSSIYKALRKIAAQGTAIIVVSSDFEELLGLSNRVVVISDGRSVADVPASYLDVERLTMLAAPRSSTGQIGGMLQDLANRYRGVALWLHEEGDRLFCLDSAQYDGAHSPIAKGGFASGTVYDLPSGRPSVAAHIRGKRGQSVGRLLLIVERAETLPDEHDLARSLEAALHPLSTIAA